MSSIKHYADIETPVPSSGWTTIDEKKRLDLIFQKLEITPVRFLEKLNIVSAQSDGQVIVQMKQEHPASIRGPLLLDLEDYLKSSIDEALCVWLEPLGDRNSLRNLRGIEVKA